jgi:hypothetical protein
LKYIIFSVIAGILASALYLAIFSNADMLQILNHHNSSEFAGYFDAESLESSVGSPLVILTVIGFVLITILSKHVFEEDMPILDNSFLSGTVRKRTILLAVLFILLSYFIFFGIKMKGMGLEISVIAGTGYFLMHLLSGSKLRGGDFLEMTALISMFLLLSLSSIGIFTENVPFRTPYFMTNTISFLGIDLYSVLIFITANLAVGFALSYIMTSFITESEDEQ